MYLSLTPVSVSLLFLFKRSGLKKIKDKNENIKNTDTRIDVLTVKAETTAVIKAASAKFKKNILGINNSKITKAMPQITINSHKTIAKLSSAYNNIPSLKREGSDVSTIPHQLIR
jgi:hypothetical protein